MSSQNLPSFTHPPVTEVVVGVVFKPIGDLTAARIGQLWVERFAEAFPRTEEQAPYEPPVEDFSGARSLPMFGIGAGYPSPRLWFLSQDGDELVQVQRNYFACNWRKVQPEAPYGRWEKQRDRFSRWYDAFEKYLSDHSLGEVIPTQCEVTYVNHIEPPSTPQSGHGEAPSILTLVGHPNYETEGFPGRLEQVQLRAQYRLGSWDNPSGRLHVALQPAFRRTDMSPIYNLELTARGRPATPDRDGAFAFFEEGRKAIVSGFASITTTQMQELWGRYE